MTPAPRSSPERFAAFNAVGLAGALVQLSALSGLRSAFRLQYLAATALAVELAVAHNFCWHAVWTWRDRPAPLDVLIRRFVRFNLTTGIVSIAGNVLVTAVLVERAHLPLLLGNVLSIGICSLLNFVVSDRLVFTPAGCAAALCVVWSTAPLAAAELTPQAGLAFERYVRLTEARLDQESRGERPFLWLDQLAGPTRRDADARLGLGDVVVSRLETRNAGQQIRFSDALCHHWVGTVFVPRARLSQVVTTMQAYDDYQTLYRPAVRRSSTLLKESDHFRVYLQLFQKKIISVVLNTESDVTYARLSSNRMQVRSRSTRIAEVDRAGAIDEREKPAGRDSGFLWRFNNYCALEEAESGVYVQCESVSLSRDVPTGLGWLIQPFVSEVPRDSLEFTLHALRTALVMALS